MRMDRRFKFEARFQTSAEARAYMEARGYRKDYHPANCGKYTNAAGEIGTVTSYSKVRSGQSSRGVPAIIAGYVAFATV